ncbi:MAG TPA: hypothetical protein VF832_09475 [Longimicrobiales bacterium]
MSTHPGRCPFCGNTDLAPADDVRWSCVGSLGCGGAWDPALIVAAPPRVDRPEETESARPRRDIRLRAGRRVLRRRPLPDAA